MTSNFTTPFRPRVKSRTVKVPRDLLPLDPTNTSIGISEREIKTEDDEVVCKEITYRRISEDTSVLTSLMTDRTDPTNAPVDSPNGRAIQVMHVVGELLRIGNPSPLYQYFNIYNATTGDWEPRSIDDTIYNLTHEDFLHRSITYMDDNNTEILLPFVYQNRLKVITCFCWYLIYLYESRQEIVDLTVFRRHQFEDFLVNMFQETMPLMTVSEWKSNRISLVTEFLDIKEQE